MKSAKWENIFKGWDHSESKTVVTLKQVPVFKNFSNKEFLELEKLIHHRQYNIGDFIFKNRAPGEGMYIIMQAELEEGDFFGELALFDDEARSANAIATNDSQLLGFFTQDLMSLQGRNPVLGQKILFNLGGVLGERLRGTNRLLINSQSSTKE